MELEWKDIKQEIHNALISKGFTRDKKHWEIKSDVITLFIYVEKSNFGKQFYIYMGIYIHGLINEQTSLFKEVIQKIQLNIDVIHLLPNFRTYIPLFDYSSVSKNDFSNNIKKLINLIFSESKIYNRLMNKQLTTKAQLKILFEEEILSNDKYYVKYFTRQKITDYLTENSAIDTLRD